ncbi:hypothetical protein Tco_0427465 [Tanacetum coccineum]
MCSRCSRSMACVKSYLHKYVEQPGPKVVFGDNSSFIIEEYGSINYGGIVFSKVAFVNGIKYNLTSISQLYDAKYIVQFDDKQGTIFNANKEIMLISPRRNDVCVLDMSSLTPNGACFFAKASKSEDDPSRQYQSNFDISYYIIPHGHSLTELTQEKHVPEVIALNEQDTPHTEDVEGPLDLINTEGTQEQNVQDEQINSLPTEETSGNNTETLVPYTRPLVLEVPQSQSTNHASTSSYHVSQDRWSKDQHIEFVNIIGDFGEGMLTRSMAAKLSAALANECLFADFLSEIELKKVSEALKHPGWVDAMQEELNQFYINKV